MISPMVLCGDNLGTQPDAQWSQISDDYSIDLILWPFQCGVGGVAARIVAFGFLE